jgi:Tfp pilus assembly protein PilN
MHRQVHTVSVLDALLDVLPHDLWIKTLEGHGREVRASGAAHSAGSVVALLAGLRASGRFGDVDLVVTRQDHGQTPDAPLLFEITCRFGG